MRGQGSTNYRAVQFAQGQDSFSHVACFASHILYQSIKTPSGRPF